MPTRDEIQALLEEILDSGRSVEEVCRDRPELVPEIRARLRRVRGVEAQLDEVFPPSRRSSGASPRRPTPIAAPLPRIPGYELQSVLGRGGMGVVYEAVHLKLKRTVAIKMLLSGPYASRLELDRFTRETEAVAQLCHPNIVHVFDAGESDGRPYLAMELIGGGSLAERLRGVPQSPRDAVALMVAIADAMSFAHLKGVVHRDLKPGNILFTADGTPKVADFGLARQFADGAEATMSGIRVGTPSYMAPEQALGRSTSIAPSVDIYALGVILYEMLTGRPPFRADTPSETERQVIAEEPAAVSALNAKVPRDLETICLKCLRKDPARRYATAQELVDDLIRFERGEPIAARPVGAIERAGKWIRRRPGRATSLAVVVALLAVAAVAGLWLSAQRASLIRSVEEDLAEVAAREQASDWPRARAALERAELRLGARGSQQVRMLVERARHDLDLADRLHALREKRASSSETAFDRMQVDRDYRAAFEDAEVGRVADPTSLVAQRIAASPIRGALLAALDDWAYCVNIDERRRWLLEIAREVDPDPSWRDRVRDPSLWGDRPTLEALAADADVRREPVPLLLVLGGLLGHAGGDAIAFLRRVQAAHPDDLWANFVLGNHLGERNDPDAIGFYRAALAIEPHVVATHVNLGFALQSQGRATEAMAQWNIALAIDPDAVIVRNNLAAAFLNNGEPDKAIEQCQQGLRVAPDSATLLGIMGAAYLRLGRFDEAQRTLRRALDLSPPEDSYRSLLLRSLESSERSMALERRLPGILNGTDRPADAEEMLGLADLTAQKGQLVAAAQFYVDAFSAQPSLAADLASSRRYNAACVAALAGSGLGGTATDLGAASRARWRQQSRQWLREDLDAWSTVIQAGDPNERRVALSTLSFWRADQDLAGIRDQANIDALPPDEQEACRALWRGVDALLSKLGATTGPTAP